MVDPFSRTSCQIGSCRFPQPLPLGPTLGLVPQAFLCWGRPLAYKEGQWQTIKKRKKLPVLSGALSRRRVRKGREGETCCGQALGLHALYSPGTYWPTALQGLPHPVFPLFLTACPRYLLNPEPGCFAFMSLPGHHPGGWQGS